MFILPFGYNPCFFSLLQGPLRPDPSSLYACCCLLHLWPLHPFSLWSLPLWYFWSLGTFLSSVWSTLLPSPFSHRPLTEWIPVCFSSSVTVAAWLLLDPFSQWLLVLWLSSCSAGMPSGDRDSVCLAHLHLPALPGCRWALIAFHMLCNSWAGHFWRSLLF